MNREQKFKAMALFYKECHDFWKREGKDDEEAFRNAIMDCKRVKNNPFSPQGEPFEPDVVEKAIDMIELKHYMKHRNYGKLDEKLIEFVEKYGDDCDEYYLEQWGLYSMFVTKCLEIGIKYNHVCGFTNFGTVEEYMSTAMVGIYVVDREGYAKRLECYCFMNDGEEYDDDVSEPYHDELDSEDYEPVVNFLTKELEL